MPIIEEPLAPSLKDVDIEEAMSIAMIVEKSSEDGVDFVVTEETDLDAMVELAASDSDSAGNAFDITVQEGGVVNIYIDGNQPTEFEMTADGDTILSSNLLNNECSSLHPSGMRRVLYGLASFGLGYMIC